MTVWIKGIFGLRLAASIKSLAGSRKIMLVCLAFIITLSGLEIVSAPWIRTVLYCVLSFWAVVLFLASLANPVIAMCAFAAYLPFNHVEQGGMTPKPVLVNATHLVLLFAFLLCAFRKFTGPDRVWRRGRADIPVLIFWALAFISIFRFWADGPEYVSFAGKQFFIRWMVPMLFYFLTFQFAADRRDAVRLVSVILMGVTMVAVLAEWDYAVLKISRVKGVIGDPNHLAAFFNYYQFLFLGFISIYWRRPKAWLLAIPLLFCMRGVMVTFSRGGYIAFAAGVMAVAFFRSKRVFLIALAAAALIYFQPQLIPQGIRYRFGKTVERQAPVMNVEGIEEAVDKSSADRIRIWKAAGQVIREQPFFGVGFMLFRQKIQHYWVWQIPFDTHNAFLLVAAEMGIPALTVLLMIFLIIFWNSFRVYHRSMDPFARSVALGMIGGIVALMVNNLTISSLHFQASIGYLWMLAGIVLRMEDSRRQTAVGSKQEKELRNME